MMTAKDEEPTAGTSVRTPGRRGRVTLAGVLVALVGLGTLSAVLIDKYAFPPSMDVIGFHWARDETGQRTTEAGSWSEYAVPVAPHRRHTYYLEVFNYGRVSQTILGVQPGLEDTEDHPSLGISTVDPERSGADDESARYLPGGVTVPPGRSRTLRWQFSSRDCLETGGHAWREELPLRIRTGWITRSVDLSFGEKAIGVYGTAKSCPSG